MPTQIDTIYNLGDDQLSNQFEVQFPLGIPFELINKRFVGLRIDQSFDIPSLETGEQELWWHGTKIIRPTRSEETDKHLPLSLRIDNNWAVFNAIKRWHEKIYNATTTFSGNYPVSPNINAVKSTIIIKMLKSIGQPGFGGAEGFGREIAEAAEGFTGGGGSSRTGRTAMDIVLTGVYPKSIKVTSIDPASNEPLRMEVNFTFSDILFVSSVGNLQGEFGQVGIPFT